MHEDPNEQNTTQNSQYTPTVNNRNNIIPVTEDKAVTNNIQVEQTNNLLMGMNSQFVDDENRKAIEELAGTIPNDTSFIAQSDSFLNIPELDTTANEQEANNITDKQTDSGSDTSGMEILSNPQIQSLLQDVYDYKVLDEDIDDALVQAISVILGKPIDNDSLESEAGEVYIRKCQELCKKIDINNKSDVKK